MGIQQAINEASPGAKIAGDVLAGATLAASWFDILKDGLEIVGLVLAVIYGAFRLYEMQTTQRIIAWLREKL